MSVTGFPGPGLIKSRQQPYDNAGLHLLRLVLPFLRSCPLPAPFKMLNCYVHRNATGGGIGRGCHEHGSAQWFGVSVLADVAKRGAMAFETKLVSPSRTLSLSKGWEGVWRHGAIPVRYGKAVSVFHRMI